MDSESSTEVYDPHSSHNINFYVQYRVQNVIFFFFVTYLYLQNHILLSLNQKKYSHTLGEILGWRGSTTCIKYEEEERFVYNK